MLNISRDNEGFLHDPLDWNLDIAIFIANAQGQVMTDEHWVVIRYIRDSFDCTGTVPEARKLLKHMSREQGLKKGNSCYLYQLFPTGYGQTAYKIAGMRKPLKLMLDV